jgi:hypothetical protein
VIKRHLCLHHGLINALTGILDIGKDEKKVDSWRRHVWVAKTRAETEREVEAGLSCGTER